MTIKRMLLLLSAMAAFVAFAAPAAQASGQFWTGTGGPLGDETEAHTFEGSGFLSSSTGGLVTGPCEVHAHGFLWNGAEMGEGYIDSFEITATHEKPCKTNFTVSLNCVLATASSSASEANPWPVTLTTNGKVDISNVTFTNRYTGCEALGIPDNFPISAGGTATGTAENEEITFVNAGHLKKHLDGGAVTIDGSVEVPGIGTE